MSFGKINRERMAMMGIRTEHYYTCKGRQRAVFLRPDVAAVRFALEVQPGDEAVVEVSYDPVETVRKGQGLWEVFEGGLGGAVHGASALRVRIGRVDGWVKMVVARHA